MIFQPSCISPQHCITLVQKLTYFITLFCVAKLKPTLHLYHLLFYGKAMESSKVIIHVSYSYKSFSLRAMYFHSFFTTSVMNVLYPSYVQFPIIFFFPFCIFSRSSIPLTTSLVTFCYYGSLIQWFLLLWDHLWTQSWWCRVWYIRDLPWNLPGRWQWKELLFQCPGMPTFSWCHFRTTKFSYYGSSTVKQAKYRLKFHITVVSTFLFP